MTDVHTQGPLPLLSLHGVGRHFTTGRETVRALTDISLTIHAGEMVAIVGPSGSGKSTLMNILGCLDVPDTGSYRVNGCEASRLTPDAQAALRRDRFGFVFQRYHLIPTLPVEENVELPALYAGTPPEQRRARSQRLLASLGLEGSGPRAVTRLSGGQQQRVSIARALMNGGDIILADEPTGALDHTTGQEVISLLQALNRDGHTIIIITHDPLVAACARRVITLSDGRLVSDTQTTPVAPSPSRVNRSAKAVSGWRGRLQDLSGLMRGAWRSLSARRLRSALTLLGIMIGIISVVSLNAAGEGTRRYVLDNMKSLGGNIITLYPGAGPGDDRAGSLHSLTPRELSVLAAQPAVSALSPTLSLNLRLRWQQTDAQGMVSGVSSDFLQVSNLTIIAGRSLLPVDIIRRQGVVVIDESLRDRLFSPGVSPLGQVILVGTLPCEVVGVVRTPSNQAGNSLPLWLPWSTALYRLQGQSWFDSVSISVADGVSPSQATQALTTVLTRLHGRQDVWMRNSEDFLRSLGTVSSALTLFLLAIALVSLLVGGIGVMNIMLVSVTERTRETGIRMAVGARRRDIQYQFLAEAVMLCLAGAAAGILLSVSGGLLLSVLIKPWRMVFSLQALLTATGCAMLTGLLSGWLPARQAAGLNPAEALVRE
ncbi:ABC transporter permease [Erwinia psidii]|uniref:ATP-binding cassette domain-containing protein n=1 Tax=Erwinia psidii TaxID=69224 RepID=A0A3N6SKY3_9GAMM|nr:ABC transporter permease [Erwinia psidii]MCX8957245.1 ATP-binding cassette domain-containing protein [Erwinia psidii]MCX8959615.1 ATP-binding cassette domain-containing protein [Erwinia psidii]MCX8964558.1 ATP-binding cassette domain-containing protein [Erwinia psidii]RQM38326.1 ATP-binding cassette domain-containing protein [Erwinia psidii]